jgi:hypothetical protein
MGTPSRASGSRCVCTVEHLAAPSGAWSWAACTSRKRLIDRCFISGAHYSICSTSIYYWRIWEYAPLIISLLMVHVGQNAPLKSMWDPPEESSTKYHVLSVAHIRNAPWIFSLLVAYIRKYAPLITCGPHLGPLAWPLSGIRVAHIQYAPCIHGGSHTSENVADLSVAHIFQYAPLIRSPRSISWQPHHHHFILLHLTPN